VHAAAAVVVGRAAMEGGAKASEPRGEELLLRPPRWIAERARHRRCKMREDGMMMNGGKEKVDVREMRT